MISPHGGKLINRVVDAAEWQSKLTGLPSVDVDAWAVSDIEMIAVGAFSPLEGFLTQKDYEGVVSTMRLADGTVWPIPITLAVSKSEAEKLKTGKDIALTENGLAIAILHLEDKYTPNKAVEAEKVFKTTEEAHPGVAHLNKVGEVFLGGKISKLGRNKPETFSANRLDPAETRQEFEKRGWKTVVAFQTRNPIHRAHEYLTKVALEISDGLLIHPLIGETKAGDIPAEVRMQSYEVLIENYYPQDRVLLAVLPAAMRYAGPREAILHALVRKNYGCTHFIIGRDHAGVGNYYGTYEAQELFDTLPAEDIGIAPLKFEYSFYDKKMGGMASSKTTNSDPSERVFLSGTRVREMLKNGEMPPPEFIRPEVAKILIEAMQNAPAGQ